jgi:hypothetical protein
MLAPRFSTAIWKGEKKEAERNRVCAMHLLTSSALAYSLSLSTLVSLCSIIVVYEMMGGNSKLRRNFFLLLIIPPFKFLFDNH